MSVSLPGGGSQFVGKEQIEVNTDVQGREYTLRAVAGEEGQRSPRTGLSVGRLIELVDPGDPFGYLTVPRADGTIAYLAASDFAEPPPFPEGPALVSIDVNSTRFFRPVRDAEDANAADNIATPGGEALQIGIHDGNLLKVYAVASTHSPDPNETVSLTATAGGLRPDEDIESFTWRFGDGTSAEGKGVSHAFSAPGTYEVTVTATGSRESGGESAPVQIVVGDPPRRGLSGAGPDAGAKPHGANGNGGGGGDGSGPVASGDGVGQPSAGGAGSTGGAGGQFGGQAQDSPSTTTPTTLHSSSGAQSGATSTAATETSPRPPSRDERTVSGVLVADASSPAATTTSERITSSAGEPSSASAPSSGGLALPLGLLALVALLGAGALYEWRGTTLLGRP